MEWEKKRKVDSQRGQGSQTIHGAVIKRQAFDV